MIHIYNTLSAKHETVKKTGKRLNMFVCGPTVYDFSHIGHARTYIAFDIIARWLKFEGYDLFYLQNITDIDDKIIARAKENNVSPKELAKEFENEYYKDMNSLGITSVSKYARATDHISQIISQVETLLTKGSAYEINGDGIYFDITTFSDYGKLSRRTSQQAEDGISRIDESIKKKNKGDFCLWKFSKENEPTWQSPFGPGRPGWHIEDTAITEYFFGPQYDLHGGAVDLKFPHHEAEIAQQESASENKPFVKIWMHTGFLTIKGERMGKSKGNFTTIRDFLKTHTASELRFLIATSHYRSPLNYTENKISQARSALKKIIEFTLLINLAEKYFRKTENTDKKNQDPVIPQVIQDFSFAFSSAMNDDFNTPVAIASIFTLIGEIEKRISELDENTCKIIIETLNQYLEILGIEIVIPQIPDKTMQLAKQREQNRSEKNWSKADKLREQIENSGYLVKDTPFGTLIFPI